MPHLLTISVSPRDATSWSRRTLDRFVTEYQAKFSDATVHNREVYDLPHLSFDALVAGRTPQEDHGPEQAAAFALQDEIVNEIERADHLVIATPMYNWSAPSALKAWVDHVVNRRTYYGAPSVFAGK